MILDKVKEKINSNLLAKNTEGFESVIEAMTEVVINDRKQTISNAYNKLESLFKEKSKIKPDIESRYNEDGTEVSRATYSQNTIKTLNNIKSKIESIEKSLVDIYSFKSDEGEAIEQAAARLDKMYNELKRKVESDK